MSAATNRKEVVIQRPRLLVRSIFAAAGVLFVTFAILVLFSRVWTVDLDRVSPAIRGAARLVFFAADWDATPAVIATVAAGVFGFLLLAIYAWITSWVHTRPVEVRPRALDVDTTRLNEEIVRSPVTLAQALVFWEFLQYPQNQFARISESIEAGNRTIRVTATYSVQRQGLLREQHAVPLLLVSRGRLEHGLRFSREDTRVSSLSHVQSAAYAIRCVRALVEQAGKRAVRAYESRSAAHGSLEDEIQKLLTASAPQDPTNVSNALLALPVKRAQDAEFLQAANVILLSLAEQYPICVWVPKDLATNDIHQPIRVTVERVVFPELRPFTTSGPRFTQRVEGARKRFVQGLRTAVGVPTHTIDFPTSSAARTMSYHLTVRGPEGSYLAKQELRDEREKGRSVSRSRLMSIRYAMNKRLGQRTGHLYARGGTEFQSLLYSCKFYERMPGSMSTALVGAAATTLVAIAVAVSSLRPHAEVSGLMQILLAFPLALTATSNFRQGAPFWGGDLAARTATFVTVVVLGASLLASVYGYEGSSDTKSTMWATIIAVSSANTVICLISWLGRAATAHQFLKRTKGELVTNG